MKVVFTTKKELSKPHLNLDIDLESGTIAVLLNYTCPKCGGYGCHHSGNCDDHIMLQPKEVLSTLGPGSKALLQSLFNSILDGK